MYRNADLFTREFLGREDGVDDGDLEFFDILAAGLFEHGHSDGVILVDDFAFEFEGIVQDESLEGIEAGGKALIFGFESPLSGADVFESFNDLCFFVFGFLFEPNRSSDLVVDDVNQSDDGNGKDDLKEFFHFKKDICY